MKPWPIVKLGDVLKEHDNAVPAGELTQVSLAGVYSFGRGLFKRGPMSPGETSYKYYNRLVTNDFVISVPKAWEGALARVTPEFEGWFLSPVFPTFRPDPGRLLPAFLEWFCKREAVWVELQRKSRGIGARRESVHPQQFLSLEIPLPALEEQSRIVASIEELAAQIHEARALRQKAAEEGEALITAETTRVFDSLLLSERHPINTLATNGENPIQIGPFGAQLHKTEFVEDGVPVLNVGNVWPDGLCLDHLDHVTEEKSHQLRRYAIRTGDLLFARSGATLGKVCLVPAECDGWLMTGHLFRVRFDSGRVFNRFAFAALRGSLQIQEQVFGQVRGATRPGYNTSLLGNVELPVPPLADQHRIVAELDALQAQVDALKSLQSETAAELDALLPAILDRAFKGEL